MKRTALLFLGLFLVSDTALRAMDTKDTAPTEQPQPTPDVTVPSASTISSSSSASTATPTIEAVLDLDADTDDEDDENILKPTTKVQKPIDEQILYAQDTDTLAKILADNSINYKQAFLILAGKRYFGTLLPEKIDYVINQINILYPDTRFKDDTLIWKIIANYGEYHKNKVPEWVAWLLKRGTPIDPLEQRRTDDTPINRAILFNIPKLVQILLDHGQKPDEIAIAHAHKHKLQEILTILANQQSATAAAATASSASASSSASTAPTQPQSSALEHPDLKHQDPRFAQSKAIHATAGVKRKAEFPQPKPGDQDLAVLRNSQMKALTSDQLKLVLSYIDDTQHPAEHYGQGIRAQYPDVDFNRYYLYDDQNDQYINPFLYALQKNTPHGLAWARLLKTARTEIMSATYNNNGLLALSEELKNTPLSPEAQTWLQSQGVKLPQVHAPQLSALHWNATKTKIVAAALSIGFFAKLYHWWTNKPAKPRNANVLINNTGSPIFIREPKIKLFELGTTNVSFTLPTTGTLWIKLDKDQPDEKDLKIDIDSYALDQEDDSYLNISIRKKWFANWFTVPLTASENWVDKTETNTDK